MTLDDIDNEIKDLCDQLEINKDNIQYVCLVNNAEFVGEILNLDDADYPDENLVLSEEDFNKMMFLHPQRVNSQGSVDDTGNIIFNIFFSDFNQYSSDPCLYMDNNKILYMMNPVKEMILEYLRSVKESYYPNHNLLTKEDEVDLDILSKRISKKTSKINIIDFTSYLKKRQLGTF